MMQVLKAFWLIVVMLFIVGGIWMNVPDTDSGSVTGLLWTCVAVAVTAWLITYKPAAKDKE